MSVLSNTNPSTDDSVGITLMKILQVLNDGVSSGTPISSTPGTVGSIQVDNSFLYVYTPSGWKKVALTPV